MNPAFRIFLRPVLRILKVGRVRIRVRPTISPGPDHAVAEADEEPIVVEQLGRKFRLIDGVVDRESQLVEQPVQCDADEIRTATENRYRAVEPSKLNEFVEEKRKKLAAAMPEMGKLFYATPHKEEVFVYRGVEGWKNYLRDILRVNEDVYTIGAKGSWLDPKLSGFMETYLRDTQKA